MHSIMMHHASTIPQGGRPMGASPSQQQLHMHRTRQPSGWQLHHVLMIPHRWYEYHWENTFPVMFILSVVSTNFCEMFFTVWCWTNPGVASTDECCVELSETKWAVTMMFLSIARLVHMSVVREKLVAGRCLKGRIHPCGAKPKWRSSMCCHIEETNEHHWLHQCMLCIIMLEYMYYKIIVSLL